ncbi:MAG: hypothetical protein U5K77_01000 [Candidatus Saccharibacteria bacterium]|nr:hypothetical protein [Candidatus Saccharibacteria bacterium]
MTPTTLAPSTNRRQDVYVRAKLHATLAQSWQRRLPSATTPPKKRCRVTTTVHAPKFTGGEVDVSPTSDGEHHYVWSAATGWINLEPGTMYDVRVYPDHLEGMAWGETTGWISFGTYTGGGEHTYANTDETDYGVNRNPTTGELSGFAWNTATGWINLDPTDGGVTHDPDTGEYTGYAWSENYGWVSFNGIADDTTEYTPRAGLGSRSVKTGVLEASSTIKVGTDSTNYGTMHFDNQTNNLVLGSTTGGVVIQNGTDTTEAFQIQNTSGSSLFTADTQNMSVGIGSNNPIARLNVDATSFTYGTGGETWGPPYRRRS